uniref:Uncharacterized protein n=1 Tax=Anopheles maculatus TaxID=74869 RepID=A0A182T3L8_9DIPT
TLIIPDHLAIRLANRSEVPANRFFHSFYQHLVQDRVVKIRKEVQIKESTNLTQLIELYHQQQQQHLYKHRRPEKLSASRKRTLLGGSDGADGQLSYQMQSAEQQGSASDGPPRLNTDEDDGSDDYEQSGNYELYSNHTTIQLDADETEQQ